MIIVFWYGGRAMEKHITATEAVRRFSEILSSVNYRGERYVIMRGKKAVARISPHEEVTGQKTLGDLKSLIKQLPPLTDRRFADDVNRAVAKQPLPPSDEIWG
jgi:antitoxin (DNA-binding transcriptional repressor) of toxin-antitoxin stability system